MTKLRENNDEKPRDYDKDHTISLFFKGENLKWVDTVALADDRTRSYVMNRMIEVTKRDYKIAKRFFPNLE